MGHQEDEDEVLFNQVLSLEDYIVSGRADGPGATSQMIVIVAWSVLPLLAVAVVLKKTVTCKRTSDFCSRQR